MRPALPLGAACAARGTAAALTRSIARSKLLQVRSSTRLLGAGYAFLQGPSTCMVRPHPGFWRVVHGVIVAYLLVLVWMLFQNVDTARKSLQVGC